MDHGVEELLSLTVGHVHKRRVVEERFGAAEERDALGVDPLLFAPRQRGQGQDERSTHQDAPHGPSPLANKVNGQPGVTPESEHQGYLPHDPPHGVVLAQVLLDRVI